jgi:hypothetical protein
VGGVGGGTWEERFLAEDGEEKVLDLNVSASIWVMEGLKRVETDGGCGAAGPAGGRRNRLAVLLVDGDEVINLTVGQRDNDGELLSEEVRSDARSGVCGPLRLEDDGDAESLDLQYGHLRRLAGEPEVVASLIKPQPPRSDRREFRSLEDLWRYSVVEPDIEGAGGYGMALGEVGLRRRETKDEETGARTSELDGEVLTKEQTKRLVEKMDGWENCCKECLWTMEEGLRKSAVEMAKLRRRERKMDEEMRRRKLGEVTAGEAADWRRLVDCGDW